MTDVAAPGFGPLTIANLTSNGNPLSVDFQDAITNVLVTRQIKGASTVAITLADPKRTFINSPNLISQGTCIEIPDGFGNYLQFALVQFSKSGDTITLTFESRTVYDLRQVRNIIPGSDVTDAGQFVHDICAAHNIPFVGPIHDPSIQPTVFAVSSGSTANPDEDSWVSFQRIASTLGWRCWESAGTIFFGPDEYWYNQLTVAAAAMSGVQPRVNSYYNHAMPFIKEFTDEIQNVDFDWDVGTWFGDMNITCMSAFWKYNPGEIVYIENMGPATGGWLVSQMQRDFFNPKGTVILTQPMPAAQTITPPTLPIVGGRTL